MNANDKKLLKKYINKRAKLIEGYAWERKSTYGAPLPTLEDTMANHQKNTLREKASLREGRIRSNIEQKWSSKDIILDDCRNFILQAVDAGGEDMARDLADTFKLLSNYAMGEYKKARR